MSLDTQLTTRNIGLDVGTSRIVAALQNGNEYEYRSQLNAFVSIPWSRMTEASLRRESVPHVVQEGNIVVHGNESARFADLLQSESRRPMTRGVLNPHETASAEVLEQLFDSVIPENTPEGTRIYYTVPAAPPGLEENLTYHDTTIGHILRNRGYVAKPINEGLAVVYSELESSNYSGIGISCGGGLCNICLAYLSVPVLSFSVPKAGDFIDSSAASMTGEMATRVRLTKEDSFYINGHFADKLHQVLNVYYDDMIRSLVTAMVEQFSNSRTAPRLGKPIPVVLSGGSSMPKGFRERFEKTLRESNFPLQISEVRMASQPLYSTARGALVASLADA
jgi:hypothetical protein